MAEAGRLQQRRVLITGAASGIGRRTALLFTAEGAALTLLDRSVEGLAEVARETRGLAVGADVTDEASVAHVVEQGAAAMGGLTASSMPLALSFAGRYSRSALPTGGV